MSDRSESFATSSNQSDQELDQSKNAPEQDGIQLAKCGDGASHPVAKTKSGMKLPKYDKLGWSLAPRDDCSGDRALYRHLRSRLIGEFGGDSFITILKIDFLAQELVQLKRCIELCDLFRNPEYGLSSEQQRWLDNEQTRRNHQRAKRALAHFAKGQGLCAQSAKKVAKLIQERAELICDRSARWREEDQEIAENEAEIAQWRKAQKEGTAEGEPPERLFNLDHAQLREFRKERRETYALSEKIKRHEELMKDTGQLRRLVMEENCLQSSPGKLCKLLLEIVADDVFWGDDMFIGVKRSHHDRLLALAGNPTLLLRLEDCRLRLMRRIEDMLRSLRQTHN